MKQKKNHHSNNVSSCKNYKKELTCKFGEKCLFMHVENLTTNITENQQNNEITGFCLQMIKQCTERMEFLEKDIKKNKTL